MAEARLLANAAHWDATLARLSRLAKGRAEHIAELIVQEVEMSPLTPVRETNLARQPAPGNLKHSFHVAVVGDDVLVVTTARYWMFVEYGARGKGPQPFLQTAIETVEASFS